MKLTSGFLGVGIIGGAVLGGSIAAGYIEQRVTPQAVAKRSFGRGVSDAQALERRRGRAATVAVAEAAVR